MTFLAEASELLAAVPHATRVGYWDAASQVTLWYPGGDDFEITIISPEREEARKAAIAPPAMAPAWEPKAYGWATLIAGLSSGAITPQTTYEEQPEQYRTGSSLMALVYPVFRRPTCAAPER